MIPQYLYTPDTLLLFGEQHMIENNKSNFRSEASESKTSVFENPRIRRGMAILAIADQIEKIDPQTFKVKSQSNNNFYIVTNYENKYRCTCPDHKKKRL